MRKIMTHIVAGFPSFEKSEEIALTMLDAGVSYLEIQIPFSDPIADGPIIMGANQMALDNGTTPKQCLDLMKKLNAKTTTPLLFMAYYNTIYRFGLDKFCAQAREAGCYGLIVPDVNIDEEPYENYIQTCRKHGLQAIQVIAPTTSDERLEKISEVASGFVYCVARSGTTGSNKGADLADLAEYVARVKKFIDLPVAVGFGIDGKARVDDVLKAADIAVVGSKIVQMINENRQSKNLGFLEKFLREIIGN